MAFTCKAVQSTKEIAFSFNVLILSSNMGMDLAPHMLFSLKIGETLDFTPVKELNAQV